MVRLMVVTMASLDKERLIVCNCKRARVFRLLLQKTLLAANSGRLR
jgi:hypothetical protein